MIEVGAAILMNLLVPYIKDTLLAKYNKDNALRTYAYFETLVYKLLERHLQLQSKQITSYSSINSKHSPIDFILPYGIDEISEPTGLIIKLAKDGDSSIYASIGRSCEGIADDNIVKRLLFVFGTEIDQDTKDKLKSHAFKKTNLNVEIWDLNDLGRIAQKHSEYWSELMQNMDKVFVNNVITRSLEADPDQWKRKREEFTRLLSEAYKKDDLVLFLGAGVSKAANIPEWKTLIYDLLVTMISEKLKENKIDLDEQEQRQIINQIKQSTDVSPLLQARYIRTGLGKKFIDVITKTLYKNTENNKGGTTELLKSITHLCTPRRSSAGIKSVVTYNFDDLLEYHLKEKDIAYIPIYKEADTCSCEELAIYHVHGYLPRDVKDLDELASNLLVFSEEGYHTVMTDPYCWSNIAQLNLLRENTCLMVGLSLTDPNLRRLLEIAARKSTVPKHYAILKRQTCSLNNIGVSEDSIRAFINVDQQLKEESYRELGLNIIWVNDYNEIPEILNSLKR